jgi:hypothetical protein
VSDTPPAGYYLDPDGPDRRWWDGAQWTGWTVGDDNQPTRQPFTPSVRLPIRTSHLDDDEYLTAFFDTGTERTRR